jgi:hypothetical protein
MIKEERERMNRKTAHARCWFLNPDILCAIGLFLTLLSW